MDSQTTQEIKKKKKWLLPVILGVAALVIIGAVIGVLIYFKSVAQPKKEYAIQLDLGEKYLTDMDYENAVLSYKAAIEIDPKNEKAYLGIAKAYNGWIDEAVAEGDYEQALEHVKDEITVLKSGVAETDSDEVKELLDEAKARKEEMEEKAQNGDTEPKAESHDKATGEPAEELPDLSNASIGSTVTFGSYEQDNNTSNGAEPIEWEVLSIEGNRALLISKNVLDCKPYNTELTDDVTWETCTLRGWMNNEFLNTAFTASEQALIPTVTLSNPDNSYNGTEGGNDTQDKVFVLSVDEIRKCYTFNSWDEEKMYGFSQKLITDATEYAVGQGVSYGTMTSDNYNSIYASKGYTTDAIDSRGAVWWLRSPGFGNSGACFVNYYGVGAGAYYSSPVDDYGVGVRPALYVKF